MADPIQSIRHKLHSIISDTDLYTVPAVEEIRQMVPTELADRELGIIKNTAGTDAKIYFRAGSNIYEIQKVGGSGITNEYTGQYSAQVLSPTITVNTAFYTIDVSAFSLIRLETFATVYDISTDKYYTFQQMTVLRNSGGTVTNERSYYTKRDLDGNTVNIDVTTEITGTNVSVGMISTEVGLVTDGFSLTKMIVLN